MHSGLALVALALSLNAQPANEEIKKILADRIDAQQQSVGIVAGVVDAGGARRVVAHGAPAKGDARPLNGDTVFEIGSITKVFTSLILADMVNRNEVSLSDPVSRYLPKEVKLPERNGKVITLQSLAMHTSALPRMPGNFKPANPSDPYADYTAALLYEFLSSVQLTRDIGEKYDYSNLGAGLLGLALARRAGTDYETLVRKRICDPLGMNDTRIVLTPAMKQRMATGHSAGMHPVSNWTLDALAGAGALRSTTNDMLTFIAAAAGLTKTPLDSAFATMLATRQTAVANMDIALAWHIIKRDDTEIIWHNGGTGGYRTFTGYNKATKAGVVVLSNASTPAGVDDIGRHLLSSAFPLNRPVTPPKERKEISLDTKVLSRYVGKYELAPTFHLVVTLEDGKLFTQATAQPKVPIFAESEREFFLKVVDAQLTFQVDGEGRATGLVLHQNGRDLPGKRVE